MGARIYLADTLRERSSELQAACMHDVTGTLAIDFTVDAAGKVIKVEADADGSSIRDTPAIACVVSRVQAMRFARRANAGETSTQSTLRFSQPQPEAPYRDVHTGGRSSGRGLHDLGSAGAPTCQVVEHCVTNASPSSCSALARYECRPNCLIGCVVCACELR